MFSRKRLERLACENSCAQFCRLRLGRDGNDAETCVVHLGTQDQDQKNEDGVRQQDRTILNHELTIYVFLSPCPGIRLSIELERPPARRRNLPLVRGRRERSERGGRSSWGAPLKGAGESDAADPICAQIDLLIQA